MATDEAIAPNIASWIFTRVNRRIGNSLTAQHGPVARS
jgi:hypothetical protein